LNLSGLYVHLPNMNKAKILSARWICGECIATKNGKRKKGQDPTFKNGTCEICGDLCAVTDSRNFCFNVKENVNEENKKNEK